MRPGTIARASDYPSLGRSISAMLCSRSDLISCREIALNPVPPSSSMSACPPSESWEEREGQCLMVHFLVIRVSCLSSEVGERSGVEGREGDGEGGGMAAAACCPSALFLAAFLLSSSVRQMKPRLTRPGGAGGGAGNLVMH